MRHISSVRAWRSLDVQKKVGTLRDRVLELLSAQPMTGQELNQALGSQSAHKRLSELKAEGLIFEGPDRQCLVTGQTVSSWGIDPAWADETKNKPVKAEKADLKKGFEDFRRICRFAKDQGYTLSPELIALGKELKKKHG